MLRGRSFSLADHIRTRPPGSDSLKPTGAGRVTWEVGFTGCFHKHLGHPQAVLLIMAQCLSKILYLTETNGSTMDYYGWKTIVHYSVIKYGIALTS